MEHFLQKSKCSIFHNIFKYMIFQRRQMALLWSKGIKCQGYCLQLSVHLSVCLSVWLSIMLHPKLLNQIQPNLLIDMLIQVIYFNSPLHPGTLESVKICGDMWGWWCISNCMIPISNCILKPIPKFSRSTSVWKLTIYTSQIDFLNANKHIMLIN